MSSLSSYWRKLLRLLGSKSGIASVLGWKSVADIWNTVANGKQFNEYPPFSERNYLQALHHVEALQLFAQRMATRCHRNTLLVSAFVDGSPLFTWKNATGTKVQGELGDILLIQEIHGSASLHTRASFFQAKRTAQADNVDSASKESSTAKELDLFERWPSVKFQRKSKVPKNAAASGYQLPDRAYELNPGPPGKIWPFSFSHFLAISNPEDPSAKKASPKWTIAEKTGEQLGSIPTYSPMAIFSKPCELPDALIDWLEDAAVGRPNHGQMVDLDLPTTDLDHLVIDLLANLLDRKDRGKFGHSGGNLISHSNAACVSFGTLDAGLNTKDFHQAFAEPEGLSGVQPIPHHSIPGRPHGEAPQAERSTNPMLVLYVVQGPEGKGSLGRTQRLQRSEYPGGGYI